MPVQATVARSYRRLPALERSRLTHDLFARSQEASEPDRHRLLEEVVMLHLDIADSIAGRYASGGTPREDLEQVARLALVKAAHGFDAALGSDFMCYAVPSIRGELRRYFRDIGWAIRPPRRVQEARCEIGDTRGSLLQELGREPEPGDYVAKLGLDPGTVTEALRASDCYSPDSLDRPLDDTRDAGCAGDLIGGDDTEFDRCEARIMLAPLVADLPDRDRTVLRLRYVEGLTQREVGERIGVTQMQVSRILARIVSQLRSRLGYELAPSA